MAMDRMLAVSNAWNWLPAFRVVAEYESIQKAAVVLNVSASALSRTVRLLEDAVGEMLFVRGATGLTLTTFGAELLRGTRDAMRRIDDVLAVDRGAHPTRVFALAANGAVLPRLLDGALTRILHEADVSYRTSTVEHENVAAELLRGNLDVVLVEGGGGYEHPPEVTSVRVGELGFALFAPPTHPLFASSAPDVGPQTKRVSLARIAAAEQDPAYVAAVAASMESAERISERGPLLAHLPRALAPTAFRVVAPSTTRLTVLAVYRTALGKQPPTLVRSFVEALRAVVEPQR
jgi:DNA-binding transcriptional LysR family regulator